MTRTLNRARRISGLCSRPMSTKSSLHRQLLKEALETENVDNFGGLPGGRTTDVVKQYCDLDDRFKSGALR